MRLIDADALIDNRIIQMNIGAGDNICIDISDISSAPTIDAEPVRHGRWIPVPSSDMVTGKAYKCSECEKMRYGSFKQNYCPNCGAKMDGGDENEDGVD